MKLLETFIVDYLAAVLPVHAKLYEELKGLQWLNDLGRLVNASGMAQFINGFALFTRYNHCLLSVVNARMLCLH